MYCTSLTEQTKQHCMHYLQCLQQVAGTDGGSVAVTEAAARRNPDADSRLGKY